jgi:arabinose-5-phosphate isomerase
LGCALVKEKNKNKLSIITDGDTSRAASKFKSLQNIKAKNIMTKNPTFIDENMLAPEALAVMNKKRITILLVKIKR